MTDENTNEILQDSILTTPEIVASALGIMDEQVQALEANLARVIQEEIQKFSEATGGAEVSMVHVAIIETALSSTPRFAVAGVSVATWWKNYRIESGRR